jgi:hypothetical protein
VNRPARRKGQGKTGELRETNRASGEIEWTWVATPPAFLIAAFSGAWKWLPGCPGGLTRIRFTSPGGSGHGSPDPEISAGGSGRLSPVPVCFARRFRAFFPGSRLDCPEASAVVSRIRCTSPEGSGRFSPDPEISVGGSGRFDPDPVQTRRVSRLPFPGSGLNRPGIAGEPHRLREQPPFLGGGCVQPGRAVAGTRFGVSPDAPRFNRPFPTALPVSTRPIPQNLGSGFPQRSRVGPRRTCILAQPLRS